MPWRTGLVLGTLVVGLLAVGLPTPPLAGLDAYGDRALDAGSGEGPDASLADLVRLIDRRGGQTVPIHQALLLADPYPYLHVEVDYASGRPPSPIALEAVRETMDRATDKEEVTIATPRSFPRTEATYHSLGDLERIAGTTKDASPRLSTPADQTYVLHIVYLDGTGWTTPDGDDQALLGLHVGRIGTVFLFPERIDTLGRPRGHGPIDAALFAPYMERAVLVHELGHAFGLIGDEVPQSTPHEDPDRPHHSKNPESVMYWSHTDWYRRYGPDWDGDVVPYAFDEDDLADLDAYRARHRSR